MAVNIGWGDSGRPSVSTMSRLKDVARHCCECLAAAGRIPEGVSEHNPNQCQTGCFVRPPRQTVHNAPGERFEFVGGGAHLTQAEGIVAVDDFSYSIDEFLLTLSVAVH
jgi:hypothetical protein